MKDEILKLTLEDAEVGLVNLTSYQSAKRGPRIYEYRQANIALAKVRQAIQALAQPAQEPVAWITPDGEGFRIRFSAPTNDVPLGWDALYTAPPQRPWVGLTDEDKQELDEKYGDDYLAHLDAVEAKLKEKNT